MMPADRESLASVIIPVYNAARYLGAALESVLAQTYGAHEIIVVDDGSTDDSAQTARRFPVHYCRRPHGGPGAARNTGVLVRGGWKPKLREPAALTDRVLDTRHSWGFADARGLELDLHWHALWLAHGPQADNDFWARAESLELDGVATRIPDPTSLLLSVCFHGAEWEEAAPLRWIEDAATILRRRGAEVEWDRLAAQAARCHASLLLHDALEYLKASLDAAVPEDALAQLKRARASELERRMQRAVRSAHALLGTLPILWYRYLLQRGAWDGPSARDFLGLPVWLKRTLAMDTRRLAVWAASRACANTGRAVRAAARSALAPFR